MFVSRISYNLPRAYEYLNSDQTLYELHRDLWSFFPGVDKNSPGPFVYCVQGTMIQMISSIKPIAPNEMWTLQTKPFNPTVTAKQKFFFDLKVNPGYCKEGERKPYLLSNYDPDKGPREEQRNDLMLEWFGKREDILGFKVDSLNVISVRPRKVPKPKKPYRIEEVFVRGVLTVKNIKTFISTLNNGVGRTRRNGCGLLIIS